MTRRRKSSAFPGPVTTETERPAPDKRLDRLTVVCYTRPGEHPVT